MVTGKLAPEFKIILYTRVGDTWYIQPVAFATTRVEENGGWTNWTHTGASYAALLVRPGYDPLVRLDLLPTAGGFVVARAVVDGMRR